MKYIKTFNHSSEYEIFVNSNDLLLPNVSYVKETEFVGFHPYVPPPPPLPEPTVIATYNAESPYGMLALNSTTGVKQLFVDDVEINNFGSNYSFETEGEHTVKIILDENATIAPYLFSETLVTSVDINNLVTSIGEYAFYQCTYLTSVTIPDSVTTIGGRAFMKCLSLPNITIPDGVTTIGDATFHSCDALTSVTIPDSVTTIGDIVFYTCTNLTSVTFGNSLTSIGYHVFEYCENLTSITCYAKTAPSISGDTFYGVPLGGTLYYPNKSNYSSWLGSGAYYLKYYNWKSQTI